MNALRRTFVLPITALVLAILSISFGHSLKRPSTAKLPPFSYLPSPQAARFVFPGQDGLGSSIAWVATVLHFADCMLEGADPSVLPDLIEIGTELDPRWEYPLEFGGVAVGDAKGKPTVRTVELLEKGIHRFPDNWNLRIYMVAALQDAQLGLTESVIADSCAKVLLPITTGRMESPEYARTLAFTLIQKSGRPDEAMRQLLSMMRMVDDPLLQVRYQEKMAKILHGSLARIGSDSLEFPRMAGAMIKSKDPQQVGLVSDLLIALAADSTNTRAIGAAKELLGQYRAYETQSGR